MRRSIARLVCLPVGLCLVQALHAGGQATAPQAVSAKTWIGKEAQIEEYMRTAKIVRMESAPRGVTKSQRAYVEPGGPVESMTWKPLAGGRTGGFRESYKAEIAAYQINRLLAIDMVPPKAEREIDGVKGAVIMWVGPVQSFADLGGVPKPPPARAGIWSRQLIRAKMFHNLIGDIDPNLGNWLVDPEWNLILVDHSRALTPTSKLVHEMQHIDAALWDRMKALNQQSLTEAVGQWLDSGEVRAIVSRRDEMQKAIDKLVRRNGDARVFVR
jgi:hypothetical protein